MAHADVDWRFDIETTTFDVASGESFEVLGRVTNLATSTSPLAVPECDGCLRWTRLIFGSPTTGVFDQYAFDTSVTADELAGIELAPGESILFTVYTASPLGPAVAPGVYDLTVHSLHLPGLGSREGGSVQITVVPEPEQWALLLAGLGVTGWAARRRETRSNADANTLAG